MARVAFIMVETEAGATPSVKDALEGMDGITEVHGIMGEFDLLARVEVEDTDSIMDVVVRGIRSVEGVVETETLLTTRPWVEDSD